MTLTQFLQLRSGDQILIRSKLGNYKRTVVTGPADDPKRHPSIVLPIRRKSWTGRPYTVADWNIMRHRIIRKLSTRADILMNGEEMLLLSSWSTPSKLIRKEIQQMKEQPCRRATSKVAKGIIRTHAELKSVGL